jgi:preprotein translocase subunit SecF
MTKLNLSRRMHLFIIISVVIMAIGMAVGTICHFLAGGFFNYGGEFTSYKSVVVTYDDLGANTNEKVLEDVCENALDGLTPLEVSYIEDSCYVEYKFPLATDTAKLKAAVDKINAKLTEVSGQFSGVASYKEANTYFGGERAAVYATIALAASIGFQLIYVAIRYGVGSCLTSLISDLNNLGIFVALVAMTRLPIGIDILAFAVIAVWLTMITNCTFFNRVRKNSKNESYAKYTTEQLTDLSAGESVVVNGALLLGLAAALVIFIIFGWIAATSFAAVVPYCVGLFAVIACLYGTWFLTPSVHSQTFKLKITFKKKDKKDKINKDKVKDKAATVVAE